MGELAVVAIAGVLLGRRLPATAAMAGGLLCLLPAVALVVAAQAAQSAYCPH